MVKHTSLCGLGQSAPNPVLSTLRYFRHEYLALSRMRPLRHREAAISLRPGRDANRSMAETSIEVTIMAVKTLTIDGKLVSAREDQTILEAAREAGIAIPTLCHLDGLTDVGACRLCLVEISEQRPPPCRPA